MEILKPLLVIPLVKVVGKINTSYAMFRTEIQMPDENIIRKFIPFNGNNS